MGLIGEVGHLPFLQGAINGDETFDGPSEPEGEQLGAFKGIKHFGTRPLQRD